MRVDAVSYGARYYDPELGRFWAIDPAAGKSPSWSPYAYCADNPIRKIDPNGAYGADFHHDLMYFAAVTVIGASPTSAQAMASDDLSVDEFATSAGNPLNWGESNLHFSSLTSQSVLTKLMSDPAGLSDEAFGAAMHVFQDVLFAHKGSANVLGHAAQGKEPDNVGQKSDRTRLKASAVDAIRATYDMLVARNGGKANISFEEFLRLCADYVRRNGGNGFKDIQELVGGKSRDANGKPQVPWWMGNDAPSNLWKWGTDRHVER